jgi:hypothetical protein
MTNIGKLERIDLRSIWRRESADFTPWLATNIEYLNETASQESLRLFEEGMTHDP